MFYNVENLFLPEDGPGEGDDDFTPSGTRGWNYYRYNRKVAGICKVILGVNGWNPPAVVCLSEIEEKGVLRDIRYHPLLAGYDYKILHRESPDHRGMDVGILYRGDLLTCMDTSWIITPNAGGRVAGTREMVAATFASSTDTVHVIACHWISKYGGAVETETFRIQQAHILGSYADSLFTAHPGHTLIAGGDLNDISGSAPLSVLEEEYDLQELRPLSGSTYKYQGQWGSLDHLFTWKNETTSLLRVWIPDIALLTEPDEKYTGRKPRRTYTGFRYNGGISDHLPLLVCFSQAGL